MDISVFWCREGKSRLRAELKLVAPAKFGLEQLELFCSCRIALTSGLLVGVSQ